MRSVVLFIAMSLDGYIADMNGSVDWLNGQCNDVENEDTYSQFAKGIDTVVMGWTTYYQVITELSPSEWVYSDFISYVITHKERTSTDSIRFVHESPSNLVQRLKEKDGKDIWICGGASIVQQLMLDGLIDKFYISIIPTILGSGVRLFGTSLISSVDENGYPATRALIQPVLIEGNDIYFATYTSSRKVKHYRSNPKACVYFYEKGRNFQGVEIKGNMIVLTDQPTKDRFWKPFFNRFYRKGVTDPDYCILKFTGFEAEWFSNFKTETVNL